LHLCGHRARRLVPLAFAAWLAVDGGIAAQPASSQRPEQLTRRVTDRMAALQREAEQLAQQSRTLLGDLRALEVERDLQAEKAQAAEAAAVDAQARLAAADARLMQLEQQRSAQLPDLKAQLVDLYKRGRGGYTRLLLEASSIRDLARTSRAIAALGRINAQRAAAHEQTLAALRAERATLAQTSAELQARNADAVQGRLAAERAVAARTALIARIDARRDLNAQLTGELQVAQEQLQRQIANLAAGRPAETVSVPIAPFRGALPWPASGPLVGRFGTPANRPGAAAVRNGIEIGAPAGSVVSAVHGGTVAYADAFTGFGQLVILDHGGNDYSLYGYLASASVAKGEVVEAGAEVGRVGSAPAGPPALYFEMRIDGRSVDPLQWLEGR
jgi:septal ring factor EnvC (AmiA/AmiB activator)